MNRLTQLLDGNGNPVNNGFLAPTYTDARVLGGSSAEVHTIPTGARNVRLTGSGAFYVNFAAAAAVPSADITNGSSSILVLTERTFAIPSGATQIGLIASSDCVVTMEFFT